MKRARRAIALALLTGSTPALADMRDYCPDRPGIDTPPCTIDPGRLSVELSGADWTHDASAGVTTDSWLVGDLALRYGVGPTTELRLAWTPWGSVRTRDPLSGQSSTIHGSGDVTVGIKQNLRDPTGADLSIALLPAITLPTGGAALGAGDWSASLAIPANVPIGPNIALLLTPEIDAATNADGHGRHLAYGSAGGIGIGLNQRMTLSIEGSLFHDDDPAGASDPAVAGASLGIKLDGATQVDIATEIGVGGGAPDQRFYVGIARRF